MNRQVGTQAAGTLRLVVQAILAAAIAWLLWYYVGVAVAAAILTYEHQLVKPGDLSRLDAAFFTMNGVMSVTVFVFALVDVVVR